MSIPSQMRGRDEKRDEKRDDFDALVQLQDLEKLHYSCKGTLKYSCN